MGTAFSLTHRHASMVRSVDTRMVTTIGGSAVLSLPARAVKARSSGKYYFEVLLSGATLQDTTYPTIGITNELRTFGEAVAFELGIGSADTWATRSSSFAYNGTEFPIGYGSSYATGDRVMVAVDLDAGKIWWGKIGSWFASGNPAAGTNYQFSNLSGTYFWPAVSNRRNTTSGQDHTLTIALEASDQVYAAPTGFTAWGEAIAEEIVGTPAEIQPVMNAISLTDVNLPYLGAINVRGAPRPEDVQTPPRPDAYTVS